MRDSLCEIDIIKTEELLHKYGSPLYVFHSYVFEKAFVKLRTSMRNIYSKYNIAYSYKTNYTPRICEMVKEMGGLAEVVSDMEYRLAKKIGYENNEIVYNGPLKGKGMFEHLSVGGVVNVDSLDELMKIINFAKKNNLKKVKIAFRVNIDIGQPFVSRFGIDSSIGSENKSDLDRAFDIARRYENIEVVGLHCHVGKSRSLESWENRADAMFKLVDKYFLEPPVFIDFGSGMNSEMESQLSIQFGEKIPSFSEYASIVAKRMAERYGKLPIENQPWLYTEPGTTIVSGSMSFLSTVQSIKRIKGKEYVVFDCSAGNIGEICKLKRLPINVFHCGKKLEKLNYATFTGYTCLEHDHIYEGFCGELAVGDIVQFRNIGSYSNVFKPPFISPNCAMVQINSEGKDKLIKRSETFDDVFVTYLFKGI